jgi:hypothetical protein
MAIGNSVANTILASAIYTGTSVGLGLGVGASTGFVTGSVIIGPTVTALIFSQMTAAGLAGTANLQLASAIGNAVAMHMATAIVQGVSSVVAIGTGTGVIVGVVGPMLGAAILAQMTAMGLTGSATPQLSMAIGDGIALAIQASIVTTTIVGVAVGPIPPVFPPIPSIGTDMGRLV